ncbi:MAG: tetratricopeptide repeat protein [Sandaracinus sp.]
MSAHHHTHRQDGSDQGRGTAMDRDHALNVRMLRYRHRPEREEPALLARELLARGRAADVVELTELALARDPGDVDLELVRAQALLMLGETQRAEESLIQVARAAPQWAAPLSALTRLLQSRGDQARALRLARRARTLGADDTMVGRLAAEDEESAKLDARLARFRTDANAEEPVLLSRALESAGRTADAGLVLRIALGRDPEDADVLAALAQRERANGHADEAVELYRRARELAPGWEPVERALLSLVGLEVPIEVTAPRGRSAYGELPSVVVDPGVFTEARALDLDAQVDAMIGSLRERRDSTIVFSTEAKDTVLGAPASEATLVGMPAPEATGLRGSSFRPTLRAKPEPMPAPAPASSAPPRRTASGFPARLVKRASAAPSAYVRVLSGDARRHIV